MVCKPSPGARVVGVSVGQLVLLHPGVGVGVLQLAGLHPGGGVEVGMAQLGVLHWVDVGVGHAPWLQPFQPLEFRV